MVAGLGPGVAVAASPRAEQAAAAREETEPASSGEASVEAAQAKARRTGVSVEVTSMRSESSDVFAQADGSLEAREYLRPVRTRVRGRWVPVDTDLAVTEKGTVAPKAAAVGLEFSGGGDAPLVRMTKAGRELSLTWPGVLPKPVISGALATYRDVLPGVDLRMEAQETGYSQLLVVNSAEAAANPRLSEVRLKLDAKGLDVVRTSEGGVRAVDEGARGTVFEAPQPMMWDSSAPGEGAPASGSAARALAAASPDAGEEPAATESGKLAQVEVAVPAESDELVLTPDSDVLRGADTAYPVFIDPQFDTPLASAWTMASKYWASSPQWKFNGESTAGMGYCNWAYCQPNDTKRLLYRIPTSKFAGKTILSAEFVVRNTWSASCSARSVELWRTKDISSATTWNSQNAAGFWIKQLKSESFAYGYDGCSAKDAEFDVKSAVQDIAKAGSSTMTFGLRAASESDGYAWKRFSNKAFLRVKYNRPPPQVKMSQLTMQYGGACKSPTASPPSVRSLGVIYANDVTDPDGDKVAVQFRAGWDAKDSQGLIARWKPALTTYKASGSQFSISLPASVLPRDGTQINWYVRTYDGAQYSPWSNAGSATSCYFTYDTESPATPTITSSDYPESLRGENDPWFDGVGKYGTFQFKGSDSDVTKYWYGINTPPLPQNTLTTSGGAARSIKLLPPKVGLNSIMAQAVDASGRASAPYTYYFMVSAGQPERAMWEMDDEAAATQAEGSSGDRVATLNGGAIPGAEGKKGTALHLDGATGYAATDIPTVNTANGFSVSAWVKLDKTPTDAAIIAAQPGNYAPGFELYYSAEKTRWVFNQFSSDTPNASIIRAMAPDPGGVSVGEWTHLVGMYSGVDKALSLYVNGALAGSTPYTTAWDARRGLQIGAGKYDGVVKSFFPGTIDELRIFDKPISSTEVANLYRLESIGNGRTARTVFPLDEPEYAPLAENETEPKKTTAVVGHADTQPLTLNGSAHLGTAGLAGSALQLDGTTGYARTAAPHTDTQRPFTVSAWAKLDRLPDGAASVVAQLGTNRPGYELYYSNTYNRWGFKQFSDDTVGASQIAALQPEGAKAYAGDWAHLVGVHDQVAQTLTLYVNGAKAGSVAAPADPFYAGGNVQVGALSVDSGRLIEYFPGQIDDVRLYDRPLSAEEVQQMFRQRPVIKGRWQFEEATSTLPPTVADATPENRPMSLYGTAQLGSGQIDNSGLELDGQSAYAATTTMPVDTGASFTMTAWAQAAAVPDHSMVVMSAEGTNRSAFEVRFQPDPNDPEGLGSWELSLPDKDTTTGATVTAVSNTESSDVTTWNHLAVVYDGFAKEIRLYVNGQLQSASCGDTDSDQGAGEPACEIPGSLAEDALSFKATKSMQIGRAKADPPGTYFAGSIDDVWAFQGSLDDSQIQQLNGTLFDIPTEVPSGNHF
ncbi:LamG-like jellyroll fold domain-containing protein [Streptomyces sp. NPDC059651]|uniref:LamG-like jellyroll fold domain-containing protein n=1 Tax=Streptomyces sp. NPDC059651 TaxID=3346897 RepID=UPI0036B6002B